jgi:hypothetical protein
MAMPRARESVVDVGLDGGEIGNPPKFSVSGFQQRFDEVHE